MSTEQPTSGISEDRDVINGVRVDTRTTAKVPIPWKDNEFFTSGNIDEVLLEDGQLVFQCNHRAERCNYWSVNPTSVKNHQRVHGGEARARRAEQELAEARAAAEAAQVALEEQRRRRSEAVKKAHETRRAKKNGQVTSDDAVEGDHGESPSADVDVIVRIRAALDRLGECIASIAREADSLSSELALVMVSLDNLKAVDPKIVEKARAYDALRQLMNN